jgi:hypothetical protein
MRWSALRGAHLIAFLLALGASACGARPSSSQAEDAGQTVESDANQLGGGRRSLAPGRRPLV